MIFDYPNNKFIEDGRTDRLQIRGFAFYVSQALAGFHAVDVALIPEEGKSAVVSNVEFIFENQTLKVFSEGRQIKKMDQFLFIMSESEVSAAQQDMYRRNMDDNNQAIDRQNVLTPELKFAIQNALDRIAVANGVVLPENINFFNDKFVLYLFPLLRTITNASTNFYKILEDLRFSEEDNGYYILSYDMLTQKNLSEAVNLYLGTNSKQIIKFIGNNLVRKTDLVKSLSPDLLNVLIKHSGKIFAGSANIEPSVKILTCYEDVMLDTFTYVRYVMDIFSNNIDHTQKFIASNEAVKKSGYRSDKNIANFLRENFSAKKIFQILENPDANNSYLNDMANQYRTYKDPASIPGKLRGEFPNGLELPKSWKDIRELHDKISANYNKIKAADNNKTIPYTETEWQLHGHRESNVELILPSEGATLVTWGQEQGHCVASYAERAARKDCLIVGVKINGQHLYTMEVRTKEHQRPVKPEPMLMTSHKFSDENNLPGMEQIERISVWSYEINQFYGYKNRTPEDYGDKDLRKIVKGLLGSVFTANNQMVEEYDLNAPDMNHQMDALRYALKAGGYNQNVADPGPPPVIQQIEAARAAAGN